MKKSASLSLLLCSVLAFSQNTKVTFLHYNDFHAHLVTHSDQVRHGHSCNHDDQATTTITKRGGIARLKSLVDQQRSLAEHSILMNIGDTFHGGVEALYTAGNAIASPINALGIDVGVPGNWDFGYGPGVFRRRYVGPSAPMPSPLAFTLPPFAIQEATFTNLAANLRYSKIGPMDPTPDGELVLPATHIIEKGGIKIGFIGITSDIVNKMFEGLAMGFSFTEGNQQFLDLIESNASSLRNASACDMVVVMSELGIHKDILLADQLPEGTIDVFFSGHTHEVTLEPLRSASGALVVEAGNDGWLGKMDVEFNSQKQITSFDWVLLPIDETIEEDATMKSIVETERAPFLVSDPNLSDPNGGGFSGQELHSPITEVLGKVDNTLTRIDALESVFNNTITDILRVTGSKDLGISPGFRYDSPILQEGLSYEDETIATGEITIEDLYRFFPVVYTMREGNTTVTNLKGIIEDLLKAVYSADHFDQEGGWVDGFSGVDVTIDLSESNGNKIVEIRDSDTGITLSDTDVLSVIGCQRPFESDGVICSHSGFTDTQDFINGATGMAYTIIDIFSDAITDDGVLEVSNRQNFHDISQLNSYPSHPWIQPIRGIDNCESTADPVDEEPLALTDSNVQIQVFPNPVHDHFTIQSSDSHPMTINIKSMDGRNIETLKAYSKLDYNLSGLNPGLYFVEVNQNEMTTRFKIVKM